jgi:hypothetical protein
MCARPFLTEWERAVPLAKAFLSINLPSVQQNAEAARSALALHDAVGSAFLDAVDGGRVVAILQTPN